jgi:hypothetical protein
MKEPVPPDTQTLTRKQRLKTNTHFLAACVSVIFAVVETVYVRDLVFIYRHGTRPGFLTGTWLFQFAILIALGCFLHACQLRAAQLPAQGQKDNSVLYFSLAVGSLCLSCFFYGDLAVMVYLTEHPPMM